MNDTRRATLLGLAALIPTALAGAARAQGKAGEVKGVDAGKMFPYLDLYLSIPAAQRTRFTLAYFLMAGNKPATAAQIDLVVGGVRTRIPVGADGRLLRVPTLAELKAKAKVEVAPHPGKYQLNMTMLAKVAPATTVAASELALAIGQCEAAIKSKAGVLGFAAPKIKRVLMRGAGSGTAVNAQGVAKPLPMMGGHPAYDPEQMPGMVTLKLAKAPSAFILADRPKK